MTDAIPVVMAWSGGKDSCVALHMLQQFHNFVFDGPNFIHPISMERADRVVRDGFGFCDLVPG